MNVGMLWLDDDKRITLGEKIERAADYYYEKYGDLPNMCYVNKTQLEQEERVGAIQVVPAGNVLLHHLWIGMKST